MNDKKTVNWFSANWVLFASMGIMVAFYTLTSLFSGSDPNPSGIVIGK